MSPDLIELPVEVLRGLAAVDVPRLPHAPPFRLLDRVLHLDVARGTLWAQKQISVNDALWPAELSLIAEPATSPIVNSLPGLLLIEALSQAAACFNLLAAAQVTPAASAAATRSSPSLQQGHLGFLVSVSDFRFPASAQDGARVGDTVLLHVQKQESLGALVAFSAQALCSAWPPGPAGLPAAHLPGADLRHSATDQAASQARVLGHGRLLFAVTSK